jgi:hypothetical protein
MEKGTTPGWGIIAHIPKLGGWPPDDEVHFDGWYACRGDAEAVFESFVRDYPTALVHIVERVASEWRSLRQMERDSFAYRGRTEADTF